MKRISITALSALLLAAPALAGQYDGATPIVEKAMQVFAQSHESGDGARTGRQPIGEVSTETVVGAVRHFAADHAQGDGPRRLPEAWIESTLVVSTADRDLAAAAAMKLDNDERGDN